MAKQKKQKEVIISKKEAPVKKSKVVGSFRSLLDKTNFLKEQEIAREMIKNSKR